MRQANKNIHNYINTLVECREKGNIYKPKGYYYASFDHLLAEAGKYYKPKEFTQEEKEYVNECIDMLGFVPAKKQCFYNAQMMMLSDIENKLEYCEGYAISIIPLLHAWVTINDKVIDLTWTHHNGKYVFGKFGQDRAYMGLNIPKSDIKRTLFKKEKAISFIDNWEDRFPLLKTKYATYEAKTNGM